MRRSETARLTANARLTLTTVCALLAALSPVAARAQGSASRHGFWASVNIGVGGVQLSSDQATSERSSHVGVGVDLGATVLKWLRVGAELDGWQLQAYDDDSDPKRGESVTQANLVVEAYPWPERDFFLKAAGGRAFYSNNRPAEYSSKGWGGTVGAGYDIRFAHSWAITPQVSYSFGGLGDVRNPVVTSTGRHFSVPQAALGVTFR